jgi:hypothetical protein
MIGLGGEDSLLADYVEDGNQASLKIYLKDLKKLKQGRTRI